MTLQVEKIERNELHKTFAGCIYENDFLGHLYMSDIASRIRNDHQFDKFCMTKEKYRSGYYLANQN